MHAPLLGNDHLPLGLEPLKHRRGDEVVSEIDMAAAPFAQGRQGPHRHVQGSPTVETGNGPLGGDGFLEEPGEEPVTARLAEVEDRTPPRRLPMVASGARDDGSLLAEHHSVMGIGPAGSRLSPAQSHGLTDCLGGVLNRAVAGGLSGPRGRYLFGVDIGLADKSHAFFDHQLVRPNVTKQFRVRFDLDLFRRGDRAVDLAANDHTAGVDVAIDDCIVAQVEIAIGANLPFEFAVKGQFARES
jgi:hypothetical protein